MALRMAEYALAVYPSFRRFPQQTVLYVGRAPLGMPEFLAGHSLAFRCRVVDIRELDGDALLASANPEENVLAVLMRLSGDRRAAARKILERIAETDPGRRQIALREFIILAGLRNLREIIREQTKTLPILDDIMDHDILGPAVRQGFEQGRVEGRVEGAQTVVMRLTRSVSAPFPRGRGSVSKRCPPRRSKKPPFVCSTPAAWKNFLLLPLSPRREFLPVTDHVDRGRAGIGADGHQKPAARSRAVGKNVTCRDGENDPVLEELLRDSDFERVAGAGVHRRPPSSGAARTVPGNKSRRRRCSIAAQFPLDGYFPLPGAGRNGRT